MGLNILFKFRILNSLDFETITDEYSFISYKLKILDYEEYGIEIREWDKRIFKIESLENVICWNDPDFIWV